ncbi:DNA replication and repair protein RecF, partial [Enterococcus hirae]
TCVLIWWFKFVNFCNYVELLLLFGFGYVVLIGENGFGKINLIEVIFFLLLGCGLCCVVYDDVVCINLFDGFVIYVVFDCMIYG